MHRAVNHFDQPAIASKLLDAHGDKGGLDPQRAVGAQPR
jgi:hypothetical protein